MNPFESCVRPMKPANGEELFIYSLTGLEEAGLGNVGRLPFSLKILLESLVRLQSHPAYEPDHVKGFAARATDSDAPQEFPYMPSRILLQDFTGVPCVVDLAALRSAMQRLGGDPGRIEPRIPVDLVIDHSVQLDAVACPTALETNLEKEFERNHERYVFLRWGQNAFETLRVLPPGLGICHQVNMEFLARCVATGEEEGGRRIAFPDTCVGTDSHTTTINSMGVLGWGVGGIEAEAAMLGQPIPILLPQVLGVRLTGELLPGATPTDLALSITARLREIGVVGRFVEFFGPGVANLSLADRSPVANMSPEYGATMGFFPVDDATLQYLRETGRSEAQVDLVERYCKEQGLFGDPEAAGAEYDDTISFDLGSVEPSVAGPKKPHDRVSVGNLRESFKQALTASAKEGGLEAPAEAAERSVEVEGIGTLRHGSVVIASITSCTNTANPSLILGAALLAKKAVERGLSIPATVRTSFAPGSRAAADYLERAGLIEPLQQLGFDIAAYGCATCIGNSGPLPDPVESAVNENDLVVAAVLSGNRNFEGRVHPLPKANYLCSPPLVVAYALAGRMDIDLTSEALGKDADGRPVTLADLWPTREEVAAHVAETTDPEIYRKVYGDIGNLNPKWNALPLVEGDVFNWDADSTYIQEPPFFREMSAEAPPLSDIEDAAVLALLGDFITTDHISPASRIPKGSPAAGYLQERGVRPEEFNSFGARRGNHEVMMRGTFANIRIRNQLVEKEGGWTVHHPTGDVLPIYDAAMRYLEAGTPLVVLAGKLYGAGSSRDWAAKGPALLGVRVVIAESFERIHRSNLVEMGVLPLEFVDGANAESLGLDGTERFHIAGIAENLQPGKRVSVAAQAPDGRRVEFEAKCRIDAPIEVEYYRHGGILNYVLRQFLQSGDSAGQA